MKTSKRAALAVSASLAASAALVPAATRAAAPASPVSASASAASSALSPDALVKRAVAREALGLEGGHATITVRVTDADGAVDGKTLEVWAKKQDGLLRSTVTFKAPAKIAGMGFLFLQRAGKGDEQYVYLPAYKKARRVTASERTTSFAGTDFTYADLEHRATTDATYVRLADETIDKDLCAVIDATPTAAAQSPYAHVKLWLRTSDDVPLRTQFFDATGTLEKTLFARKIKVIDGKPIVTEARLERAGSKRVTEIVVESVSLTETVGDGVFSMTSFEAGG